MIRTSMMAAAALITLGAANPASASFRFNGGADNGLRMNGTQQNGPILRGTGENGARFNGAAAVSSAIQATGIRLPNGVLLRAE